MKVFKDVVANFTNSNSIKMKMQLEKISNYIVETDITY